MMATGCVSVLPETKPPKALIRLPMDIPASGLQELDTRVVIHRPDAPGAISGPEIASVEDDALIFIADVRWADSPSAMLQAALIDQLSKSAGEGWAASIKSGARGDFELRWNVRELAYDETAREGVCDLRVMLMSVRNRNVVAIDRIRATQPSQQGSDEARARAIAEAMASASNLVAAFVAENATSDRIGQAPVRPRKPGFADRLLAPPEPPPRATPERTMQDMEEPQAPPVTSDATDQGPDETVVSSL